MQDLSYQEEPTLFSFRSWQIEFHIYTFENVYALEKHSVKIQESASQLDISCQCFSYAGGQKTQPGIFTACMKSTETGISVYCEASFSKTLRDIKISIHQLPKGEIINLREGIQTIPPEGCIYTYPSGWRGLASPFILLETLDKRYFYARSLDPVVREKRFALIPNADTFTLELIFEETGSQMTSHIKVPEWEIGYRDTPSEVYQSQRQQLEMRFHPQTWEKRADVPEWMRQIGLIASIHMEHWTGYTFHTYQSVVETARWISTHIHPRHVLLYLPGWDGRYYWNYGHYEPSESMGGKAAFRNMIDTLHDMGFHVMLMVGMNMANRCIENFEQWGNSSLSVNVSGIPQYTLVDWDGSRQVLHGFHAMLAIGAPHWQNRLTQEIISLYQDYHYDSIFLDISACWTNEQLYDDYAGIQAFIERLHAHLPKEILIAGEAWYDGLTPLTPLVQSGHTDGVLHWHDTPYAPLFDTWCRSFGHLCLGDPGRGSTGVHELGYNPITSVPYRKGIIPTVTIVEDTLTTGKEGVMDIIKTAQKYVEEYI